MVAVISRHGAGLPLALRYALGAHVDLRHFEVVPTTSQLGGCSVVVAEMAAADDDALLTGLRGLAGRADLWLVVAEARIGVGWLLLAREPRVQVVMCAAGGGDDLALLASALLARFGAFTGGEIAEMVLSREPSLRAGEGLVRAVCGSPWEVRRPQDLARHARAPLGDVRRICRQLGFDRVEHFIVAVREVACAELARRGVGAKRARNQLGLSDSSNRRRQLARARRQSSGAFQGLTSLLAALVLGLLPALGLGCSRDGSRAETPASARPEAAGDTAIALPVVGAVVRRGDLVLSVRTIGQVRAERLVNLRAETQGTVVEVRVRAGDRVDSGQVLARLDPRPFEIAIREAEAALADARERLHDILIGDDSTDTSAAALTRRRGRVCARGLTALRRGWTGPGWSRPRFARLSPAPRTGSRWWSGSEWASPTRSPRW